MESVSRTPEVNGKAPPLGLACSGFKLVHYYENAQIADVANVTYLCLGGTWFRVYFEPETVFWRSDGAPPTSVNSDLTSGLLVNDLSEDRRVVGRELQRIEYEADNNRTFVVLYWSGGCVFRLEHSHVTENTILRVGS